MSKRENERSPELQALLGNIPYLNGGLFDLHTLESAYPHIDIPDEAFERLFAFFNEFDWHLDNRPLRNDKEINPDVLNNLYGVDIMEEATEICKLRLFLKLVSQVEKFDDIEPLPDIDFNIRAGNTLVGFASHEETCKALQGKTVGKGIARDSSAYQNQMVFDDRMDRIEQKAQEIERAFDNFRRIQTEFRQDGQDMAANKQHIRQKLKELGAELDGYLASEYGIDRNNIIQKDVYDEKLKHWQESHQPFHWWIEFYGIMKKGGFDVIIGNPPYVEYSKVRNVYRIKNYKTEPCGNLYAFITERCQKLQAKFGRFGMILPSSAFSTERMKPLVSEMSSLQCWFSFYDFRPAKLFDGVNLRLSIVLAQSISTLPCFWSTTYNRWFTEERKELFVGRLHYQAFSLRQGTTIKVGETIEKQIYEKIEMNSLSIGTIERGKLENLYFHDAILYWIRATDFSPSHNGYLSTHVKTLHFGDKAHCHLACSLVNSSLFYWWWIKISNCRDLNVDDVRNFHFALSILEDLPTISRLHEKLMKDFLNNSQVKMRLQVQTGEVTYREFNPVLSKPIIDEIDRVLAQHYGFTDEELDFIINYDIKYRMGRDSGDEGEE